MTQRNFTCWRCRKDFVDTRPDGEAKQEAKALWGNRKNEEMVPFCDDCFKAFMRWRGGGKVQG